MAARLTEAKARRELATTAPRDFTPTRNRLVKALRAAGDDAGARAIAALKKPRPSVWGINALSREGEEVLRPLLDAGAQVRLAQRKALSGSKGHDLRGATRQLQEAVAAAAKKVAEILRAHGESTSSTVMSRVHPTLLAAASGSDEEREALRDGRLEDTLSPAGFGEVTPLRIVPPSKQGEAEAPAPEDPKGPTPAELRRRRDAVRRDVARRQKEAEKAAREQARLEKLASGMEERAKKARARAQAAASDREAADRALAEAQARLEEAQAALRELS